MSIITQALQFVLGQGEADEGKQLLLLILRPLTQRALKECGSGGVVDVERGGRGELACHRAFPSGECVV